MPNWCNNKLTIYGPEHALTSFMTAAKTEDSAFSMGAFFPMPEELLRQESPNRAPAEVQEALRQKYGAADWYEWALANWGTKWDFTPERVNGFYEDGEVEIDFDTAWGPPVRFLESLAAKFPSLTFTHMYAESGMGFGGMMTYRNGEIERASSAEDSEDTAMLSEWHALMMGFESDSAGQSSEDEDDNNEGGE